MADPTLRERVLQKLKERREAEYQRARTTGYVIVYQSPQERLIEKGFPHTVPAEGPNSRTRLVDALLEGDHQLRGRWTQLETYYGFECAEDAVWPNCCSLSSCEPPPYRIFKVRLTQAHSGALDGSLNPATQTGVPGQASGSGCRSMS